MSQKSICARDIGKLHICDGATHIFGALKTHPKINAIPFLLSI